MTSINQAISHISPAPEESDDPLLSETYDRVRPYWQGNILNYHRVFGVNPRMFHIHLQMSEYLMEPHPDLTTQDRFIIGLVVSKVHRCPYLEAIVDYFLLAGGVDEGFTVEEIAELRRNYRRAPFLSSRQQEICRFAERVAENPRAVTIEDYARLQNEGITDRTIFSIVAGVAYHEFITTHMHALGIVNDLPPERVQALAAEGRLRVGPPIGSY
ncbi:MAG: hypothetical protein ABI743_02110 [bacterium]